MPSTGYYETIARGYDAFGLPFASLSAALERTRERLDRKGVTQLQHDGRKRMRPVGWEPQRPTPPPATKKVRRRRDEMQLQAEAILRLTPESAARHGITPATLLDLQEAARERMRS